MSQFSGSTPIGGVVVTIDADRSPLDRAKAKLRSDLGQWEKELQVNIPKAQRDVIAAALRSNPTLAPGMAKQMGMTAQQLMQAAGIGGGGGGAAAGAGAGAAPAGQGGGGAGGGGGGGAFGRRMYGLGRMAGAFAIARTAEAIMDFGTAAIQATRSMKIAQTDQSRINTMIKDREAGEAALSRIPLIGSLLVSAGHLGQTLMGNSPQDIARTQEEAEQQDDFSSGQLSGMQARRRARAKIAQDSAFGGSTQADIGMIIVAGKEKIENLNSAKAKDLANYQEDTNDPDAGLGSPGQQTQAGKDWAAKNTDIRIKRTAIAKGYDTQIDIQTDQNKLDQKRYDWEVGIQRDETIARTRGAELIQKHEYAQASANDQIYQYANELKNTKKELRESVVNRQIAETKAQRSELIAQIGSTFAENTTLGRDIIGDPLGIRRDDNPLKSTNITLNALGAISNNLDRLFDTGAQRLSR